MPGSDDIATRIHRQAQALLRSGIVESALVEKNGKVADPIAIHGPDGEIDAWFVGIVVADKLAGFMRMQDDLTLLAYSSFQRRPDSIDECPDAASWLDTDAVLKQAGSVTGAGAHLDTPVLAYDKHPSRVVWQVRASGDDGMEQRVLVAGGFAYLA